VTFTRYTPCYPQPVDKTVYNLCGQALRCVGIDYGDKHIGVAVSSGRIASPLCAVRVKSWDQAAGEISRLAAPYGAALAVVGMPYTLSGEEGAAAKAARQFAERLKGQGFAVEFEDERFSSREADHMLYGQGLRGSGKVKAREDALAAAIILQAWLDRHNAQILKKDGQTMASEEKTAGAQDVEEAVSYVELLDEDGNKFRFEHLMTFDVDGQSYIALGEDDENGDEDAETIVTLLKVVTHEDGTDSYEEMTDETLHEAVYDVFLQLYSEQLDGSEDV